MQLITAFLQPVSTFSEFNLSSANLEITFSHVCICAFDSIRKLRSLGFELVGDLFSRPLDCESEVDLGISSSLGFLIDSCDKTCAYVLSDIDLGCQF